MASSRGKHHSDTAKEEQMIAQFFTKTLHTILESRSPYLSSRDYSGEEAVPSPLSSGSSSWSFRIALRECPAALENAEFWRQSNVQPMVVDVILVQRSPIADPMNYSPEGDRVKKPPSREQAPKFMNLERGEHDMKSRNNRVIERWVVQYEGRKSRDCAPWSKKFLLMSYKKLIVLLRSLYVRMRLLPAHKLFRDLISCGKIRRYTLTHHVSSFVEPFTHKEEADMQKFSFTPVDTSCGRLCLSVSYRSSLSDVSSEPSAPMSPQFIPDYVGSPLADPLKRFPSLPGSHGSPSCSAFSRRHSWGSENYQASLPSTLPFPSPASSDSHASISKCRSQHPPSMSSPHQLPKTFQDGGKSIGSNEYWPSPVFSPFPPPFLPIYTKTNACKAPFRCESAPDGISATKTFNIHNLPPSPPPKLTRAATLKSDKYTGGPSIEKLSIKGDESGRLSGARLSSTSSPQISLSGTSSRPSIQDDFDDSEFPCHFVDDADMIDPGSRVDSFDHRGHPTDSCEPRVSAMVRKSQDAEVGALVLMLKKAPPLRQDMLATSRTTSCRNNEEPVPESNEQPSQRDGNSGYSVLRTAADALEELQGHKELKDWLLCEGYRSLGVPGAKPV